MAKNVGWHEATVTRALRERKNYHHSFILWFTCLSGAGKSTLAHCVEQILFETNRINIQPDSKLAP